MEHTFTYGDIVIPADDINSPYSSQNGAIFICLKDERLVHALDDRLILMLYGFECSVFEDPISTVIHEKNRRRLYHYIRKSLAGQASLYQDTPHNPESRRYIAHLTFHNTHTSRFKRAHSTQQLRDYVLRMLARKASFSGIDSERKLSQFERSLTEWKQHDLLKSLNQPLSYTVIQPPLI